MLPHTSLKNAPKKVFEYFYRGIADIKTAQLPLHGSYESFNYNESGDLLEYTFHLSNTFFMTFKYTYNSDGYKVMMHDQSTVGFEEKPVLTFQKNENNGYTETQWNSGDKRSYHITFEKDGNEITKEAVVKDKNDVHTTVLTVYDGQLPLTENIISSDAESRITSTKTYYYSKNKYLDSIRAVFGGEVTMTYFINNEHGDPLQEVSVKNNDTTLHYTRQFAYDEKGNWIRMVEKENVLYKTPAGMSPYILIERKITY